MNLTPKVSSSFQNAGWWRLLVKRQGLIQGSKMDCTYAAAPPPLPRQKFIEPNLPQRVSGFLKLEKRNHIILMSAQLKQLYM